MRSDVSGTTSNEDRLHLELTARLPAGMIGFGNDGSTANLKEHVANVSANGAQHCIDCDCKESMDRHPAGISMS